MKAWKKLAALAMALGMTMAFAACGGGDNGNSGNGNSGAGASSSSSQAASTTPEELGEAEMEAAIADLYAATNFTVVGTKVVEEYGMVFNVEYTAQFADGKVYQVTRTNGVTTYAYIAEEDGVYYSYNSMDNEEWDREEYPLIKDGDPTSAEYHFSDAFYWAIYSYHDFVDGENVFTNLMAPELHVKVVGGKIVEYKIIEKIGGVNTITESGIITYGNAVVGDLPTISE